jgi:hypothetical protein
MHKKIVIIPCFGEGHFTKLQIENLVNTINPDYIIFNEGLFPSGPENKGGIDVNFQTEFCYENTNLAWDTKLVQSSIKEAQELFPNIKIIWNQMNYETSDANICYVEAVSNFKELGIEINEGDIIFPLEGDVFFHENDIALLNEYLENLKPNEGLQAPYVDFMENQYYVEGTALNPNTIHYRRIAIKFGTWDYYKSIVVNFMSQRYPLTVFPKYIFHYAWWRPGKYKQLRVAQLRRDVEYHNNFLAGLELAKQCKDVNIVIRPNRSESDPNRYICKIDIQHPKEIINHPNYIN